MSILEKRENYKPFEYPEILLFTEAIQKAYWVHGEVDFTSDVQDFNTGISETHRSIITRAALFVAQTEVNVKLFWGSLYNYFPKPEFNGLGSNFAECEFRHSEAYSQILTVLGLENRFVDFVKSDLMVSRSARFKEILTNSDIFSTIFYFTVITENTSLFSSFASILALNRFEGKMKNVANIINWTATDEQIHANAGIYLMNKVREENIDLSNLDATFHQNLQEILIEEDKVVDWIFELGEFTWFTKQDVKNFMRSRVDEACVAMKLPRVFNITKQQLKPMAWFDEEILASSYDDFFARRPVDYTKHDKTISGKNIF